MPSEENLSEAEKLLYDFYAWITRNRREIIADDEATIEATLTEIEDKVDEIRTLVRQVRDRQEKLTHP